MYVLSGVTKVSKSAVTKVEKKVSPSGLAVAILYLNDRDSSTRVRVVL